MTLLCVSLTSPEYHQAVADVDRAIAGGAQILELRLDLMGKVDVADLIDHVAGRAPVIVTARSRDEGGAFDGDDMQRVSLMVQAAARSPGYIDCELATYQRSANIRRKLGRAAGQGGRSKNGLILSAHDFSGRPGNLADRVDGLVRSDADVVKVVWMPRSITDNFEALGYIRELPKPTIAICMGPAGLPSRILAKKFGAFLSFCTLEQEGASAPGQVTLEEMVRVYRWGQITPDTKVYGVIGCPVGHSMSPAVHNAAFEQVRFDGVYLPLHVEPGYEPLAEFLAAVLANRWADFRGLSVTVPHKENALRWVRGSGGRIDPLAERIGAINTIAIEPDGVVWGLNTDYAGAVDALTEALGCGRPDLQGLPVAVLGARGAARAIVAGMCDCGCRVTVYNRTAERAAALAQEFGCSCGPWEERGRLEGKIVINATSMGMHRADDPAAAERTPLPPGALRADMVVFDAVYNPIETKLLRDAAEHGCRRVNGVTMFVNQAAAQFQRWTRIEAPRALMYEVVRKRLE